jgi:hypothetical protein
LEILGIAIPQHTVILVSIVMAHPTISQYISNLHQLLLDNLGLILFNRLHLIVRLKMYFTPMVLLVLHHSSFTLFIRINDSEHNNQYTDWFNGKIQIDSGKNHLFFCYKGHSKKFKITINKSETGRNDTTIWMYE